MESEDHILKKSLLADWEQVYRIVITGLYIQLANQEKLRKRGISVHDRIELVPM